MNNRSCCGCNPGRALVALGIVLGLLAGLGLAGRLLRHHPGQSPRQARAGERAKNMDEHRQALAREFHGSAVLNAEAGIYRIPIEHAMEITAREWRNPEAARKQLIERVNKAFAAPAPAAPAAPEPKSKFE